jgi:hypothetical protein
MTKVALLFYGQPRFVHSKEVQESYKQNILTKYDTTVFCHTWFEYGRNDYDYSTWSNLTTHNVPENAIDIILDVYHPNGLSVSPPQKFTLPSQVQEYIDINFGRQGHWNEHNYSNLMSQLFSIQTVSNYIQPTTNNFDWIVLARYDTILYDFPDLSTLNKEKFHLPDNHRGFPDMINIYSPKFLDWSRNVFNDIETSYMGIHEPTPESFKHQSFLKRYTQNDLEYIPVRAIAERK